MMWGFGMMKRRPWWEGKAWCLAALVKERREEDTIEGFVNKIFKSNMLILKNLKIFRSTCIAN